VSVTWVKPGIMDEMSITWVTPHEMDVLLKERWQQQASDHPDCSMCRVLGQFPPVSLMFDANCAGCGQLARFHTPRHPHASHKFAQRCDAMVWAKA
jgi:hypothetical protein